MYCLYGYYLIYAAAPSPTHSSQPEVSLSPVAEGTPTEKEQQEVAMLWAMEETTTPRRWDEEKELDYSQMSRKREEELASKTGEDWATFSETVTATSSTHRWCSSYSLAS